MPALTAAPSGTGRHAKGGVAWTGRYIAPQQGRPRSPEGGAKPKLNRDVATAKGGPRRVPLAEHTNHSSPVSEKSIPNVGLLKVRLQRMPGPPSGFVAVRRSFIRNTDLSGDAKLIGVIYAAFANQAAGKAFPSPATLKRLSGMGRNRVRAARNELVRGHYLAKVPQLAAKARFGLVDYRVTTKLLH